MNRSADKLGTAEITPRHTIAPDVEFSSYSHRQKLAGGIEDVDLRVRQRMSYWHWPAATLNAMNRRIDCGLRWTIAVEYGVDTITATARRVYA